MNIPKISQAQAAALSKAKIQKGRIQQIEVHPITMRALERKNLLVARIDLKSLLYQRHDLTVLGQAALDQYTDKVFSKGVREEGWIDSGKGE